MSLANQPGLLHFGVVILGAGTSSRMGRPKLLLPWQGTSVVGHLLELWQTLDASQITVVCAETNQPLQEELDRLRFPASQRIVNSAPERGMFSSIQCAARWNGWKPALTHWAIALGDQPHVRLETLQRLLEFGAINPGKVCQPSRNGRGRHPVLLPAALFSRLREASDESLKQFLIRSGTEPARCEMDDAGLDIDLDEPADYERALQLITTHQR